MTNTQILEDLAQNAGYGDLNRYSAEEVANLLKQKCIKVVAAGPARNIQLTKTGRKLVATHKC